MEEFKILIFPVTMKQNNGLKDTVVILLLSVALC